jgi:pimeloyl-ACP methyl ester carboxylesterase
MDVARTKANGIEIEYETFGGAGNPAILLIMGLGGQLTLWPDDFCEALADRGFFTVRYDNRDVGLSTDFHSWGTADLAQATAEVVSGRTPRAPYLIKDMAADAVGLLDALAIERAHIVGMSMGGMIAQTVAGLYPQRTRSLVSIMSTSGRRGLPPSKPEAMRALLTRPENGEREVLVQHGIMLRSVISGPGYPTPDDELRALVERNVDRRYYPDGINRQYLAVLASGDRIDLLKTVAAPTLVLHGSDDPLIHPEAARDVASLVRGAKIEIFEGWGHDLPPGMTPLLVDRISSHCIGA